jgi:hypothetical protein
LFVNAISLSGWLYIYSSRSRNRRESQRALRLRASMAMSSTDRKREGNPLVDEISDLKRFKREIAPPFAVGRTGGCLEESLALDLVVSGVANGSYVECVCFNRVFRAW